MSLIFKNEWKYVKMYIMDQQKTCRFTITNKSNKEIVYKEDKVAIAEVSTNDE